MWSGPGLATFDRIYQEVARDKREERDKQDVRDRRDTKFEVPNTSVFSFRPPHPSRFSRQSRPSRLSDAAKDLVQEMFLKAFRKL